MNYFTYNGSRSDNMGVRIISKNVFSAPKYDLTFQAIPGRDGDLISPNGRFPNVTITYSCFLPAKSLSELADKATAVKAWLYKEPDRYHTLTDTYDPDFSRRAVFNNKLDISDELNKIGPFTVSFSCHPMRFLLFGQEQHRYTTSGIAMPNPYPFASKPYIRVNGSGAGTLTVQSSGSNRVWTFSSIAGYTECDSELMNFYKDTTPKNDTVTGTGFPTFLSGNNTISFGGGITSVDIIPRWQTL